VGERRLPEVDVGDAQQRQPLQSAVGADEVLDELVGRRHQQLGRRGVLGQDPALLEDRDPVAHLDRLVDVVGDEQDRLADLRLQPEELVLEALAVDRVDRAEGLVHQHQRRVRRQRPRDSDALLLAAGQLRWVAVPHLGVEADQLEQLGDPAVGPFAVPADERRDSGDVLPDRAVGEEPDLLDDVAHLATQRGRVALPHRAPADEDVALGDLDRAVDHPHRGGLAAARRADQHADLAGRDLEAEVADGRLGLPGVALAHAPVLDRYGLLAVGGPGLR
jgi:hypothetical protein